MKKNIIIIFIFLFSVSVLVKGNTTFNQSLTGINMYNDNNFVSGIKGADLPLYQYALYGIEYQNSYFGNLFSSYNFFTIQKIRQLGFGLFLSDKILHSSFFKYSTLSIQSKLGYTVLPFLSCGINFKFFHTQSEYLNSIGFNNDVSITVIPLKFLSGTILWSNVFDFPVYWSNDRKESVDKKVALGLSLHKKLGLFYFSLMGQYDLSNITISSFSVDSDSQEGLKVGAVLRIMKYIYFSGGLNQDIKSYGISLNTQQFIFTFSNSIKNVGNQMSINLTFKGGLK